MDEMDKAERKMDKTELWRIRTEDFARNFESLRGVEWRVVFQLYVGYAALALAFHTLTAC